MKTGVFDNMLQTINSAIEVSSTFFLTLMFPKRSPGAAVTLLPCDHEVMGSSTRNSLLQKCRKRLRT
jgi:hypothetical protein